jgi:sulfonate transport system ATP-binding protein
MSSSIELIGVSKRHPGVLEDVLQNINLRIKAREIVSIIGPSGCGKSTLLRLLAGLDRDHRGTLKVGGEIIRGPNRSVGFMFQEPRPLPWLTVRGNLLFGMKAGSKGTREEKVRELLERVQLSGSENRYPRQLSGGMLQRTAIARALAAEPQVLLLDEPFSSLDAFTRMHLQELLISVWEKTGLTMLLVTHDIDEALYLSDRVVVLTDKPATIGEILEVDLPRPRDRNDETLFHLRKHLLEKLRLAGRKPAPANIEVGC